MVIKRPLCMTALALLLATPVWSQGTLFVEGNNVGIGTATPQAKLEVTSSDGSGMVLVDESGASLANRTLFDLRNNGAVQFFFRNTASSDTWQMTAFGGTMQFSRIGSNHAKLRIPSSGGLVALRGSNQLMDLSSSGDMTIAGTLTQGSSRDIKSGISQVDAGEILEKVAALPIAEWVYTAGAPEVRHLGPMAEDFHAAFGLGADDKHLAPGDVAGVALASVQQLHARLREETARRSELETRNQELEARLQAIESLVAELRAESLSAAD